MVYKYCLDCGNLNGHYQHCKKTKRKRLLILTAITAALIIIPGILVLIFNHKYGTL